MNIRILFLKARQQWFPRFAGKYDFNEILRADGIEVGEHTIFYSPNTMSIDRQRPWLLHIGDYCKITKGTVILTHDYSRSVLRRRYGEVIGEAGRTYIGDNVFIGMNSIILMGSHIGNNVIVGAGSVVSGHVPDDCVIAGNPARIIRTLDEHYEKMKAGELDAASLYLNSFYERYGRIPGVSEMGPFFPLFLERSAAGVESATASFSLNGDDREEVIAAFMKTQAPFESYEAFVRACLKTERPGQGERHVQLF